MNPIPALTPHLKQLRLSGILDSLEARNRQAIDTKLAYTEFLALLIEDEVARREQKKFATRLRRAAFRTTKTLDSFGYRSVAIEQPVAIEIEQRQIPARHASQIDALVGCQLDTNRRRADLTAADRYL